jgi:MarC family membrane protein
VSEILAIAIPTFITLFVVIDPVGIAPVFATLTEGTSKAHKRQMAFRGTFIGALVLLFFAIVGEGFLGALGITMPAFRTAGGIMLFLIAIDMVFEKRSERRERKVEEVSDESDEGPEADDISVFPIAVPFIAGPGSIGTVMLLVGGGEGDPFHRLVVLATLGVVLLIALGVFLIAGRVMGLLGPGITKAFTRVLGIVLAALAIQLVFDGIAATFLAG